MEPAARWEQNAARPPSGINHAVEAQTYLNCIEHHLGNFTAAMAGCRSAVTSLQEELSTCNAVLFHQIQNPNRNTVVYETLLKTNGNMVKEIEHLLRLDANHQADTRRWNRIYEGLQHTINQLGKQLAEKNCEITQLRGYTAFAQTVDEPTNEMVQSPVSTYSPTQISKSAADSEYASATERCTCPDSEIAKIGLFVGAVGERHNSDISQMTPAEFVTDQRDSDTPEAVNQRMSMKEEKPSLRRKGKLTLLPC